MQVILPHELLGNVLIRDSKQNRLKITQNETKRCLL